MPPSSPKRPCITGKTMSTEEARCSVKSDNDRKPWARLQTQYEKIFNFNKQGRIYPIIPDVKL